MFSQISGLKPNFTPTNTKENGKFSYTYVFETKTHVLNTGRKNNDFNCEKDV